MGSGWLEDQLALTAFHRKYRLVAASIGGAPEILRSTDRQRARGLELAEELLQASADRIGRLMCDGLEFEDQLPCGSKAADLLPQCRTRILESLTSLSSLATTGIIAPYVTQNKHLSWDRVCRVP